MVADATVMDQVATATGTTSTSSTVSSGATAATTANNELAVGVYTDSGFGDSLTGSPSMSTRANVSPVPDMEMLVEDSVVGAGATPAATVGTGANTVWGMA